MIRNPLCYGFSGILNFCFAFFCYFPYLLLSRMTCFPSLRILRGLLKCLALSTGPTEANRRFARPKPDSMVPSLFFYTSPLLQNQRPQNVLLEEPFNIQTMILNLYCAMDSSGSLVRPTDTFSE